MPHTHTDLLFAATDFIYITGSSDRKSTARLLRFSRNILSFCFFTRFFLELMNMQRLNWLTPTLWVESGNKPHPQQLNITACYDNLSITQTNFFCKYTLFIEKNKTKLKTKIVPPERRWVRGQVRRSNSTHKEIVREFEKVHRHQTSC